MSTPMTPEQEHEFYGDPDNQTPQGPAPAATSAHRTGPRFDSLPNFWRRFAAAPRPTTGSVSSWIRRAVEHELDRSA